jgi:predicted nucleic acid-binding protein
LSVSLDASVLIALFTKDALSARADAALRGLSDTVIVTDYAALEFSSALARMARSKTLSVAKVREALVDFDAWVARAAERVETSALDIETAMSFVRRLTLSLRGPDAINVAIASRVGATLLTFDEEMARSARRLGVSASGG